MSIEEWWPRLHPATQAWLVQNNGDLLPNDVVAEITEAGGSLTPEPTGFSLPDDAVDWIEAIANGEVPGPT
jgi:hypothetical protein